MAQAEASSEDDAAPAISEKAAELKKEFQRVIKVIIEEDDWGFEIIDEAIRILSSLRELCIKTGVAFNVDDSSVPEEFKCPLSKELMADPVVLASGQTYDRPNITNWLNEGHKTCPNTQVSVPHTSLVANELVREMISLWCKDHGIEPPKPIGDTSEEVINSVDAEHLNSLLNKMSSSLSDQKQAARDLRLLTKKVPSSRALLGELTNAIPQLLKPLTPRNAVVDLDLQEDLITTIFNFSIYDENSKRLISEDPAAIPLLIESLTSGNITTRRNAAAALFTLTSIDSNKVSIGTCAMKPLINLLIEDDLLAMKDAASAIFSLCLNPDNREMAARLGAVRVILDKIVENVLTEELLATLALLVNNPFAQKEIVNHHGVPSLLGIMRGSTSDCMKENCIVILHEICLNDSSVLRVIKVEENRHQTLSKLSESGTERAKRKASGILQRLHEPDLSFFSRLRR